MQNSFYSTSSTTKTNRKLSNNFKSFEEPPRDTNVRRPCERAPNKRIITQHVPKVGTYVHHIAWIVLCTYVRWEMGKPATYYIHDVYDKLINLVLSPSKNITTFWLGQNQTFSSLINNILKNNYFYKNITYCDSWFIMSKLILFLYCQSLYFSFYLRSKFKRFDSEKT